MSSPQGTPAISKWRLPDLELSRAPAVSEQDINIFEDMFKEFLETEHKILLAPPSFLLNVPTKPTSTKDQREIKIIPINDITVMLAGHPIDLLTLYSCNIHELFHIGQMSHLEVMRKYVDVELAIYALFSILRASMGRTLESVVKFDLGGKKPGDLSFDSPEFEDIIMNMRKTFPYLPLKMDRDIMILLESIPMLNQLLALEKPGVKKLRGVLKESIHSSVSSKVMDIISKDPKKSLYLESVAFTSALSEILPGSYLELLLYASYLTGLGAQGLISLASKIAKQESKVKVLTMVKREVEGGGNCLELVFEYNVFEYEEFVRHKDGLLRIINDALEICKKGGPFNRLRYLRQRIDNAKTPSELQSLTNSFSYTIFSKSLAPDQLPTYYIHTNGLSQNREEVLLFLSFFADLTIAINILNALVESLEKGGSLKKTIENAIRCPLKRAPQMKCVWNPECEHEKFWLDSIYGP